jgi:beta-aspartyl-peptidase (threonine type)
MKEVLKLVFVLFFVSCTSIKGPSQPTFGIVIHGGAGTILKENMTPEMEHAYENKLSEAISE